MKTALTTACAALTRSAGRSTRSSTRSLSLLAAALAGLAALAAVAPAAAQDYPTRTIRIFVPFTPGGGIDTSARIIGKKFSDNMGVPVIVENRPGGNTLIGTEALVRSAPDGYTLIMHTNNLSSSPALYGNKLPYDTFRDLAPISLVAGAPHVLVVHPSVPARNLAEFIALAKAKPGSISFASAGSGTVNHLAGEMLKRLADINMLHVPYKGSGSVMPDLLANHVNALFASIPNVTQQLRAGTLRAIAVTSEKRFRALPDVPSVAELGYPGYDIATWRGLFAPGATPQPIIRRLHAEVVKALKDSSVQEQLADSFIVGGTPEELAAFLRADIERITAIIRFSGAKVDPRPGQIIAKGNHRAHAACIPAGQPDRRWPRCRGGRHRLEAARRCGHGRRVESPLGALCRAGAARAASDAAAICRGIGPVRRVDATEQHQVHPARLPADRLQLHG